MNSLREPKTVSFNASMLSLARKAKGMTQEALSKESGFTQGFISKIENERHEPSREQCEVLASALQVSASMFFRQARHHGLPMGLYRKTSIPKKAISVFEAQLDMARFEITRLMESVEVEPSLELPLMEVGAGIKPQAIAQMLRQTWGVPQGPLKHIMYYLESAGIPLMPWPGVPNGVDAIMVRSVGADAEFIAYNPNVPGDRLRFTLAHELGHRIMHRYVHETVEQQANEFAAEFLMPERVIKSELKNLSLDHALRLKQVWHTSIASLVRRAKTLNVITDSRYKSLCIEINRRGWRKNEPIDIPQEKPVILNRVLDAHFNQLDYSVEELASALHISPEVFLDRYRLVMPARQGLRLVNPIPPRATNFA